MNTQRNSYHTNYKLAVKHNLIDKDITNVMFTYMNVDQIHKYKCPLHKFKQSTKTHIFMEADLQKFVSIREMEEQ